MGGWAARAPLPPSRRPTDRPSSRSQAAYCDPGLISGAHCHRLPSFLKSVELTPNVCVFAEVIVPLLRYSLRQPRTARPLPTTVVVCSQYATELPSMHFDAFGKW